MGSAHFTLLTPTFTAGVDQTMPELRVPTIKGQLRWWTRALYGNGRPEYDLFGGIKGKRNGFSEDSVAGSYLFRLIPPPPVSAKSPLCPHDPPRRENGRWVGKGEREALQPNPAAIYELHWCSRFTIRVPTVTPNLDRVIRTWLLLGSVGCRSNRAAGSVWPAGYEPSVAEFDAEILALALPSHLAVRVIGSASTNHENLRKTATDTLRGSGRQTGNIRGRVLGDVLGFVKGSERKASALKLKVGRFSDDYRLIAIFDLRHGRATARDYTDAVSKLVASGKPLGNDLHAALAAKPL